MTKSEYVACGIMTLVGLGFVDTLWMFGVENSKEYTWWYVLHTLAGGK